MSDAVELALLEVARTGSGLEVDTGVLAWLVVGEYGWFTPRPATRGGSPWVAQRRPASGAGVLVEIPAQRENGLCGWWRVAMAADGTAVVLWVVDGVGAVRQDLDAVPPTLRAGVRTALGIDGTGADLDALAARLRAAQTAAVLIEVLDDPNAVCAAVREILALPCAWQTMLGPVLAEGGERLARWLSAEYAEAALDAAVSLTCARACAMVARRFGSGSDAALARVLAGTA